MGPGMRTIARVDSLPKACKDKMGAAPADPYPCASTLRFSPARERLLERRWRRKENGPPWRAFQRRREQARLWLMPSLRRRRGRKCCLKRCCGRRCRHMSRRLLVKKWDPRRLRSPAFWRRC
ncbi:hypothetical protein AXF42_Ash021810 [Apostasia shenzhenica]|uniref:Uncharacterized protein n=1 Tax=Apostasia shenzhenica TaxID=1088818 RepID=A0A2H9ZTQ2_9ASPA|nr:hypothetical protein AXF42_Ash021810 [Apostasia shenzhenica]